MAVELKINLSSAEKETIAEIFSETYYTTYFNGVTYVAHLLLRVLEDLGVLGRLKNKNCSCDEIIRECNLNPNTKFVLDWTLSFLSQGGYLKKSPEKSGARYSFEKVEPVDLQALFDRTMELDSKILPSARLMEYVASEYGNFFKGTKKGFEILFAQDKMALWNEYFSNDNSGYRPYNALGALGVLKWALNKSNIRFLEVGGGTAGASAALIDLLKEKGLLSNISEYIFSDVSPAFLRLGNRAIMSRVADDFQYSLMRIDFDKPLVDQKIKEDSVDVAYGVNALHVAKDLVGSLRHIHRVLKPGGMIILSESCRPNADYLLSQEIIFNLLDNYVNVDLDQDLRPNPGFLDGEHWRCNLEAAGFRNVEAIFNTDGSYPPGLSSKIDILAVVIKGEKYIAD
jgi:SAM-dependent methyltransferase